jgi:four helix bundle protein
VQDYRNLVVWQKAMILAESIYRLTNPLPRREVFGLSAQIRRSAVSIPSNIAEGSGRGSDRDFTRFLRIAFGSACELKTQLQLVGSLGMAPREAVAEAVADSEEIRRMLGALIRRLQAKN